jgi:hypothetical protein
MALDHEVSAIHHQCSAITTPHGAQALEEARAKTYEFVTEVLHGEGPRVRMARIRHPSDHREGM